MWPFRKKHDTVFLKGLLVSLVFGQMAIFFGG
jgi:hypothetical protein